MYDDDRAATSLQQTPRGRLRITVPASTQFLAPFITDYLRRCDGVQIDILFTDRFVNLVEESFDIAIRAGALSDSTADRCPIAGGSVDRIDMRPQLARRNCAR